MAERFTWPDGKRCAVVISFDVDAESGLLYREPKKAARSLTALEERRYGPRVGLPRILGLLDRLKIASTFFVPGWTAENHAAACRSIVDAGHEIGAHGNLHESPEELEPEREEEVLIESLAILKSILGVRPVGYRAPFFGMNLWTPALLRRHGFQYDSSLPGNDIPYLIETPDGPLVELPALSLLVDVPYYRHVQTASNDIALPSHVLNIYKDELRGLRDENGLFVLIQHPEFVGRPSRMAALEDLVTYVRSFPDVWLATAGEVADWVGGPGRSKAPTLVDPNPKTTN